MKVVFHVNKKRQVVLIILQAKIGLSLNQQAGKKKTIKILYYLAIR